MPEPPCLSFPAARIVGLGPPGIDTRRGPALGVVPVPAGVTGPGEPYPCRVHPVGEIRERLIRTEQGMGTPQPGKLREIEDEGQLHHVGGAQLSVQSAGAPRELVAEGGGLDVAGVCVGPGPTARAEQRVTHDGGPQLPEAGSRAGPAVRLDEACRIAMRARRRVVDVPVVEVA